MYSVPSVDPPVYPSSRPSSSPPQEQLWCWWSPSWSTRRLSWLHSAELMWRSQTQCHRPPERSPRLLTPAERYDTGTYLQHRVIQRGVVRDHLWQMKWKCEPAHSLLQHLHMLRVGRVTLKNVFWYGIFQVLQVTNNVTWWLFVTWHILVSLKTKMMSLLLYLYFYMYCIYWSVIYCFTLCSQWQ